MATSQIPSKLKTWILESVPKGEPTPTNFRMEEKPLPKWNKGELLVKPQLISVDPYLRGKMSGSTAAYTAPYKLRQPLYGFAVGQVIDGDSSKFKKGEMVHGEMDWMEYCVVSEDKLHKIPEGIDAETAISVCGMTGVTAYIGLEYIGKIKQGETLLVSGAAGAVGTLVGQLAKAKGCKVIGVAGGDDKMKLLKELGFDYGINYKTMDVAAKLKEICPNGIDVYWDNVGGPTLDAAIQCLKTFGRVINCGAISGYNASDLPQGPRMEGFIVAKRLKLEGFIVFDHPEKWDEGVHFLAKLYKEGKLQKKVTIEQGFDHIPKAFIDMMNGKNVGKMIVKV